MIAFLSQLFHIVWCASTFGPNAPSDVCGFWATSQGVLAVMLATAVSFTAFSGGLIHYLCRENDNEEYSFLFGIPIGLVLGIFFPLTFAATVCAVVLTPIVGIGVASRLVKAYRIQVTEQRLALERREREVDRLVRPILEDYH